MCTGLCRKLRRRYAAVLLLAGAAVLLVARRESPAVDSELRLVEETISAEVGRLSGSKAAAAGPAAAPGPAAPGAAVQPLAAALPMQPPLQQPPPPPPPPQPQPQPPEQTPPLPPPHAQPPPSDPAAPPAAALPPAAPVQSGGTVSQRALQKEWKPIGETRTDAIDVDPILAQLSYANPWNPAPSGSKGIGSWTQGWDVKYDDADFKRGEPLKVFVMPHSHNDPGWLWSFEGYYQKYTGGIITTVIRALKANPDRRFIWAEISFFELWWQNQGEDMRQKARDVVKSGQLEFVTAGWVMNDEANCDIYGILEQLYEGREWVEDTFGILPSTGYAVDPFGQSAVMAQVLKRMGYDAMYINRVQYAIKRVLAEQHNMDFVWRQHWDAEGSTDMMVHMHPFFNYDVPHSCGPQPGVCCQFDFLRLETPGMTCPWGVKPEVITSRNVAERSRTYLDQIKKKATLFGGRSGRGNSVLVPIGGDLEYQHDSIASKMYENYEAMFKHINNDPSYNVHIQFGTLKDYFDSVAADYAKQSNLRVLSGPSFFTYADKDEEYWSGYYTSRPFYKHMNRELEGLLHAAQMLQSSLLPSAANAGAAEAESGLRTARRAMALFQHHDAITVRRDRFLPTASVAALTVLCCRQGTSKHATMDDYGKKLYNGVIAMQCLIVASLRQLGAAAGMPALDGLQFHEVRQAAGQLPTRATLAFPTDGAARLMVLFNPSGRARTSYLQQAVDSSTVCVRDADGSLQPAQINPLYQSDLAVRAAGFELISPVEVPAFAIRVVEIVRDPSCQVTMASVWQSAGGAEQGFPAAEEGPSFVLKNAQTECSFRDGLLQELRPASDGASPTKVSERFMKYQTSKSGAYIFLPSGQAGEVAPALSRVLRGPFMQVAHVLVRAAGRADKPNVARLARLGADDVGLAMEHYVDVTAQSNEEWIVRYDTDYKTGRQLFTELNSWTTDRHVIRDERQVPVQTKYFPMPGGAFLEDTQSHRRFSLQAGQPCGVGSMSEGSVEVMLDRRLTKDDARGMNEVRRPPAPNSRH